MSNNFSFEVTPNILTVSYKNPFTFYIKNTLSSSILVDNNGNLSGEQYPDIDAELSSFDSRGFYIHFPYGSGDNDIATVADSEKIELTLVPNQEMPNWEVCKRRSTSRGVYFIVFPIISTTFPAGQSLTLSIKVDCNDKTGTTVINAQFDKDNKQTQLYKRSKPQITRFKPKETTFSKFDTIHMEWTVKDGEDCKLLFNDTTDVTGKTDYAVQISDDKSFMLKVQTKTGYSDTAIYAPPYISEFTSKTTAKFSASRMFNSVEGDFIGPKDLGKSSIKALMMRAYEPPEPHDPPSPPPRRTITLEWKTKNTSYCTIPLASSSNLPTNGSIVVSNTTETRFKLHAVDTNGYTMTNILNI